MEREKIVHCWGGQPPPLRYYKHLPTTGGSSFERSAGGGRARKKPEHQPTTRTWGELGIIARLYQPLHGADGGAQLSHPLGARLAPNIHIKISSLTAVVTPPERTSSSTSSMPSGSSTAALKELSVYRSQALLRQHTEGDSCARRHSGSTACCGAHQCCCRRKAPLSCWRAARLRSRRRG